MSQAASAVASVSSNEAFRQTLRSTTEGLLKQYFSSTLYTVDDMSNIFLALMLKESSFNANARYKAPLDPYTSSGAKDYYFSPAIQSILSGSGNFDQKQNEPEGRTALGLTQVMGWNIVKGASRSGKCVVEQYRPDLVSRLCINPGDSAAYKLLGPDNIENSILAGLVVLESKYKIGSPTQSGGWGVRIVSGGTSQILQFPSRIYSAVAGYLGYGTADANGTNYLTYASQIVGGSVYAAANGAAAPSISGFKSQTAAVAYSGPTTSGKMGTVPGCVAAAASTATTSG